MALVTPCNPNSQAIASATSELPILFNEFNYMLRDIPQRVPNTHQSYTAIGLDSLLRDPPPRIARSARCQVMSSYLSRNPRLQIGTLYGRDFIQNAQNLAQYFLSTEPRRKVNVPPTRPSQQAQPMQNEFGPSKLQAPTNETWSAPTHSPPRPPHDYPGLWAEALQLQLIPPGRAMVSTGTQSVNPTPGTASAAGADHVVRPNTRHRNITTPREYQNLTPIAEPSSGLDDVSPRKEDGAVQQAKTFPSFIERQPPGGTCSGYAETGKKCDSVTGSGVACECNFGDMDDAANSGWLANMQAKNTQHEGMLG
ncbi:hypothetical protein OBBRIDRAFT_808670 [Obba rivulosa]|uniref:Uncharacterized protein n=1 Tax=Obba rivulosa TaxID=1052685 RepID=A0A8E2DEG2_9APHY|nr:hypothetical protein OBBRIDRAFT_808670 [Obba rivulosa]